MSFPGERPEDCYQTPPELLQAARCDLALPPFTLDAAADAGNAVADRFLCSPHRPDEYGYHCECGLCAPWAGSVWCNPPYSDVAPWVAKAIREGEACQSIAMLLLADTSTRWFKAAVQTAETYLLTPGRVSFINPDTGKPAKGNRIGSVLFVWRGASPVRRLGSIALWDWRR